MANDREAPLPRRPLRILHTENTMAWGGQEVRILEECRGMQARGHDVFLVAARGSRLLAEACERGIPCEGLAIDRKGPRQWWRLRRWLARRGRAFDVINTHGSTDSWLTALSCATLSRMPAIVRTRHVSTPVNRHLPTRWLYLASASHIVTTGEAVRRQLHRDNGYPLARMTSVRTGIDLDRFAARDQRTMRRELGVDDAPTLGVLATLRGWKGHRYLLLAFARLVMRHPAWRLLILGDGPQRAALERLADELGLQASVRFVGNVDAVPEWLSVLDLFALPSTGDEGVPQSIMQAMACGLPVVSTSVGAIDEAVQHGVTGTLVPPRDAFALASALDPLMSDASLRTRLGEAGRAFAVAHFGIDAMLDRMEAVFASHART